MKAVRRATEADIPAIAVFEAEIAAISFGDEAVTDPKQHTKKISRALEKGEDITLVLAEGPGILGWLWVSINTNMFTQDRYANFRSFALAPQVRGGDWGVMLFNEGLAAIKAMGGISKVVGKVHVDNLPMRILYKELGFRPQHLTMELKV